MNNEINNQKKNLENQNVQNDLNCKFGFFLFFLNKNSIALKKIKIFTCAMFSGKLPCRLVYTVHIVQASNLVVIRFSCICMYFTMLLFGYYSMSINHFNSYIKIANILLGSNSNLE